MTSLRNQIARRFPDNREAGDTTLHQCQLVMARMLKILDFICSRHEIDYWMSGGTLLGAVRHQGFIPWDCDIDVGIRGADLGHLKNVVDEFPADIFFQDSQSDPYYPAQSTMVKLRDRYSNYVEWQSNNPQAKWHNGLQADLFLFREDDDDDFLINPFNGIRDPMSEIFPCIRLEFEGASQSAPNNYHNYLVRRYGDYMQLPAPGQRLAHEGVADPFTPCDHPESLVYLRHDKRNDPD